MPLNVCNHESSNKQTSRHPLEATTSLEHFDAFCMFLQNMKQASRPACHNDMLRPAALGLMMVPFTDDGASMSHLAPSRYRPYTYTPTGGGPEMLEGPGADPMTWNLRARLSIATVPPGCCSAWLCSAAIRKDSGKNRPALFGRQWTASSQEA